MTDDLSQGADVVVIGSGAGGSTVFRQLARAGLDVLLLEEGADNSSATGYSGRISDLTAKLYRRGGLTPVMGLPPFAFGEGATLGGTTEINGGLFWRTPEWVLEDWSQQLGLGHLSPTLMEPLFSDLEQALGAGPTSTEPGFDRDSELLVAGATALGWHVVPAQRVVPQCSRRNQCGSGCATGAKQSMAMTFIPDAAAHGGRVATRLKAVGFRRRGIRVTHVVAENPRGEPVAIPCREVVVSGGALQSPALLRRGRLSKTAGRRIGFHLNTKILAQFKDNVDAQLGTMFTHQVQEFMRQGILIMASNYRPEYLSLAIANWKNEQIEQLLLDYSRTAMYTMMVRPKKYGSLLLRGNTIVPVFRLGREDQNLLARGTLLTVQSLFAAGAVRVHLPLNGSRPVSNVREAANLLARSKAMDWELSSVHAMASCPMGTGDIDPVDANGRVKGWQNVSVADASVLPTTIGESPQETIMAISSLTADAITHRVRRG